MPRLTALLCTVLAGILTSAAHAALPESLRREAAASVERAADTLRPLVDRFPVAAAPLAVSEGATQTLQAALRAYDARAAHPWTSAETVDASLLVLAASYVGMQPGERVLRHLALTRFASLPAPDATIVLLALEACGIVPPGAWDDLAARPLPPGDASPPLAEVLARAIAREARSKRPDGLPSPDALAFLRHAASRLALRLPSESGPAADPAAQDPLVGFLATVAGFRVPRRLLADPARAPLPFAWRERLAEKLLESQIALPSGGFGWVSADRPATSHSEAETVRATVFATLALQLLSQ